MYCNLLRDLFTTDKTGLNDPVIMCLQFVADSWTERRKVYCVIPTDNLG